MKIFLVFHSLIRNFAVWLTIKSMRFKCIIVILLLFLTGVCQESAAQQRGKATFYAKRFNGARTASGVRLHNDSLVCAHKTHQFGTLLLVKNPANGKQVVVKVIDRGPYVKGRIIDLSQRAARELGILAQGVAMVEVSVFKSQTKVPYKPVDDTLDLPEIDMEVTTGESDSTPPWQIASDCNIVILGDSNTSIGGDDCSKSVGWNKWFREMLSPASCRSYARSGATWTNTTRTTYNVSENTTEVTENNVIYNQINRLKEAVESGRQMVPNLIMIMAGTNDAWFADKRPNAFSLTGVQAFTRNQGSITRRRISTVLTLAESVRYGCEMLQKSFPKAKIVLLTPLQNTHTSSYKTKMTGDIIETCGKRMNIDVIRLDEGVCIDRDEELEQKHYTFDGVHTNEEGAKCVGAYVTKKIHMMLKNNKQ